jgi:hypothetical protein
MSDNIGREKLNKYLILPSKNLPEGRTEWPSSFGALISKNAKTELNKSQMVMSAR